MQPIEFPGSREIGKPKNMTDEQCFGIQASSGIDASGFPYFLTHWMPSHEDLQAMNAGRGIFIKQVGVALAPMAVFTLNENGESNDAG